MRWVLSEGGLFVHMGSRVPPAKAGNVRFLWALAGTRGYDESIKGRSLKHLHSRPRVRDLLRQDVYEEHEGGSMEAGPKR